MDKNKDMQLGIEEKSWYFFRYQELVIMDKNLDAYDKVTYGAICKFADSNTGISYPSLTTLQKLASCSMPRLIKSIDNLEKAGYIKRKKRLRQNKNGGNKSNIYKVIDLSYISNAKKYAKENNNKKMLKKLNNRLEKHPIPTEEEITKIRYNFQDNNDNELEKLYESGYR